MSEYPQKETYKLSEVCRYTDTQPYVLRFWESEFPQLNPERSGGGQPVYRKADIDLVRRIKQLLYDEECSLELARQALDNDKNAGTRQPSKARAAATSSTYEPTSSAAGKLRRESVKQATLRKIEDVAPAPSNSVAEVVSRQRYENAVEEVHHLRLKLQEAEKARHKVEVSLQKAVDEGERQRIKAARAGERIEEILESLS